MTKIRILLARLTGLVRRSPSDAALNDDIQAHLDLLARDFIARGLSPQDARAAARRAFGGVEQMKERYRDQRGLPLLDALAQDVRYAGRMIRRNPGFAAVAILSLAIGIGASTAAFTVFNAVMLRPLPVAEPHRLVLVEPYRRGNRFILFNPIFEELRARQTTLSGMFAGNDTDFLRVTFQRVQGVQGVQGVPGRNPNPNPEAEPVEPLEPLEPIDTPEYVHGSLVSGNYFSVLGLSPAMGRLLTEHDDQLPDASADARCAAVISHSFWTRRFQQSPDAIGRSFRVQQTVCVIVGITGPAFESHQTGYVTDIWLPLRRLTDPKLLASRGMAFFGGVMGRLAPGVEIAQAEAELTTLYQQAQAEQPRPPAGAQQPPANSRDFTIHLSSGAQGFDAVRRQYSAPLLIVLGVVAVVLVIACVNIANLLLARGAARLPELATRAALGAGRGRLLRQLITEGCVLATFGGALGAFLAWLVVPILSSQISLGYSTILIEARADARVVTVAVAVTVIAALLAGVLPALRLSVTRLSSGMAIENRSTVASGQRLTRSLVAAQLALSLLLVSAAGLLLRTIVHLAGIDPGFAPEHVVMLDVRDEAPRPSFGAVETAEQKSRRANRYRVLDERLNALPGVRSASVSWLGLFSAQDLWLPLIDVDHPDDRPLGRIDYVSTRYFETMGMQILRGRGFTERDREATERVAVINETLARTRFGAGDPLGRRIALDYRGEQQRPFTVVGIVRDSKYNDLREARLNPMMWVPIVQAPFPVSSIALRTLAGGEAAAGRQAEELLRATDPYVMTRKRTTLAAQVAGNTARERLLLGLSSGFAGVALLLAAVGLYGTLAYAVSRRTREIGVRLAFGAQRGALVRMILGEALRLAAVSLAVGLPASLAAAYALRAFLFGVTPTDPAVLIGASAALTLTALLAAYIPARRAAAVDPIVALRCE